MFRAETEIDQAERIDLAVWIQLLAGLKTLESVCGIVSPLAVHRAVKVAAISERLLNLLVTFGIRMELVTGRGSLMNPGPMTMPGPAGSVALAAA